VQAVFVADVVGRLEIAGEEEAVDGLRAPAERRLDFKGGPFAVEERMHRRDHQRAAAFDPRGHRGHDGGGLLDEFERMGAVHEVEPLTGFQVALEVLEARLRQPDVGAVRRAELLGMFDLRRGDVHGRAGDAALREPDAVLRRAAAELERGHAGAERREQTQRGLAGDLRPVVEVLATDAREGLVVARHRVPVATLPIDVDPLAHRALPFPAQPLKTNFFRAT